jgi:hypothetical protein
MGGDGFKWGRLGSDHVYEQPEYKKLFSSLDGRTTIGLYEKHRFFFCPQDNSWFGEQSVNMLI